MLTQSTCQCLSPVTALGWGTDVFFYIRVDKKAKELHDITRNKHNAKYPKELNENQMSCVMHAYPIGSASYSCYLYWHVEEELTPLAGLVS